MSVIITISFNEPLTTLLRTVHSLFYRTPWQLLGEVILVDDFTGREDFQGLLERYLVMHFPTKKIRLIRLSSRVGFIKARMIGAHVAIGDVIMFMDAHTEPGIHW